MILECFFERRIGINSKEVITFIGKYSSLIGQFCIETSVSKVIRLCILWFETASRVQSTIPRRLMTGPPVSLRWAASNPNAPQTDMNRALSNQNNVGPFDFLTSKNLIVAVLDGNNCAITLSA